MRVKGVTIPAWDICTLLNQCQCPARGTGQAFTVFTTNWGPIYNTERSALATCSSGGRQLHSSYKNATRLSKQWTAWASLVLSLPCIFVPDVQLLHYELQVISSDLLLINTLM